jgi:hypothetical protein
LKIHFQFLKGNLPLSKTGTVFVVNIKYFAFSDNAKYAKKIKQEERLCDYDEAVSSLFREQDVVIGYEAM